MENIDTNTLPDAEAQAQIAGNLARFATVAVRYRDDADFRARIDGGDTAETVEELGISVPPGLTAKLLFDSPEVLHVCLPPDPNVMLQDESLMAVAGGKTAGTAGTVGSAGSVGCSTVPSTVSSAGSLGTAGSAS